MKQILKMKPKEKISYLKKIDERSVLMKKIVMENNQYELIKNYKEAFQEEVVKERYTSYFEPYDYIVGDIAYNKLRLKGFYDQKNKKVKPINNYNNLEVYLKENCAVDCKYFILKKVEEKDEK